MLIGILSGVIVILLGIVTILIVKIRNAKKEQEMLLEFMDELLTTRKAVANALAEHYEFGISKVTNSDGSGSIH